MDRREQIEQLEKLIGRLDSGTNVDAGGFRYNPTSVYTDPDLAARERAAFFDGYPQLVGLSGDLPGPGTFLTIDDLRTPMLATRNRDGAFRVFVNACRHRGVVLETSARGEARRFACAFHGWTYDSDGVLVGLPKADHFGDLDLACHGLIELPSLEQDGLLWAHPDPAGSIDLDAMLTPALVAELGSWNLAELSYLDADAYDVACNWKLAMDTFGETYHFASLHKDTLFNGFHGNVQCYDTFGRNHRMLLCRREIDEMRKLPRDEWHVSSATLPVYWLFPNVQLMPSEFGLYLVRAYPHPSDPGRHTSQITFYLRPHAADNADMSELLHHVSQRFGEVIRDEDYVVSASQQRSAESGVLEHVVFGRNEPALHHYHGTYRAELGMDPLPLIAAATSGT